MNFCTTASERSYRHISSTTVFLCSYYFTSAFITESLSHVTVLLSAECSCRRPPSAGWLGGQTP